MAHIRVDCTCGKVLKVTEQYAGKKGRCVNCGKPIQIPTLDEIKKRLSKEKEAQEERCCPTCGAFINKGDKFCVSCHTNLSTGEWENPTLVRNPPPVNNLKIISAVTILAVLICIALSFVAYRFVSKDQQDNPTKSTDELGIAQNLSQFLAAKALPENNLNELDKKIEAVANATTSLEEYVKLLKKKSEMQAQEQYALIPKNNPCQQWHAINRLLLQYSETQFAKDTLIPEEKNIREQLINQLKQQVEEANLAITNKEHTQALEKTVQYMANATQEAYPAEMQECFQALQNIHQQAIHLMQQAPAVSVEVTETTNKELTPAELDNLKQEFYSFLPEYRRNVEEWKFQELFSRLQPMAVKAEEFRAKYPDDPDLIKITDVFHEIKLLTKAWDYAIEGAASLQGKDITLWLKKNKTVIGRVLKYEESKLSIQKDQKDQKPQIVDLKELAPRSIGMLALYNSDKSENAEPHLALTAFYYINKKENECLESIESAQKLDASIASVERYQKWAVGVKEERKKNIDQRAQQLSEEQRTAEQKQEEQRLAKLRQEAWTLVKQMLIEYRLNRDEVVLQYLCTLKTQIGDKPGGRDELIKIHYDIKKTEGHSLSTIASNSYYRCPFCRGDGNLKCRECKGEGFTKTADRWIDKDVKISGEERFCTTCNGKGIIDCPYCQKKRQNPNYIMVKDYYGQF